MYYPEKHKHVRDLSQFELESFYYGCESVMMNLLFNGGVNHRFRKATQIVTGITGCRPSAKILLYHSMLALGKGVHGFVVPLRRELFTSVRNDNPSRNLPSYNSFTNALQSLVDAGYGKLYRGDRHSPKYPKKFKSVFVMADKFKSLFTEKDKTYFPVDKGLKYNDLVRVMSQKMKNGKPHRDGKRYQLDVSPRGINLLKDEVLELYNFLLRFEYRTGQGDRFYPELYRSFVENLHWFGRFYFAAQNMESDLRKGITIEGECVMEWDISSNHAFICAEQAGFIPPDGFKPYHIAEEGLVTSVPEGGSPRDVYKKAVICLTTCTSRGAVNAFRSAWKEEMSDYGGVENAKLIMDQLRENNKGFIDKINSHNAATLQYIDSCILLKAMQYLMERGIPFLPYHDSMVVPESSGYTSKEAFEFGWESVLGSKNCCFVERKY